MQNEKWLLCPVCGNKTRIKIRENTVLLNFPLFCPKCKREQLINVGKAGDWVLYPLNAIVMDYCNVAYKPCITVIFPYWIKMIYDGQEEINSYFNKAFDVVIDGREKRIF